MMVPKAYTHFRDKLAFETDAWDLSEMRRENVKVVVVDARSEAAYAREHIPQAINLPHREMNPDSTKGALKLSELGFQVKELIGGIDWWKRDGYPTESSLVSIAE